MVCGEHRGGSLFGYWHGSAQAEQESLNGPSCRHLIDTNNQLDDEYTLGCT